MTEAKRKGANIVGFPGGRNMKHAIRVTVIAAAIVMMLCGCKASSLPNQADEFKASQEQIRLHLEMVTAKSRSSGSQGEGETAKAIEGYFASLGYEAEIQTFVQKGVTDGQADISGTNVSAIRKAGEHPDQADILIISAHHDGKAGTLAACDNGSGVAVMMEAARLISQLPSDTEIRFLSFAGEETGRIGSRYYVEQMGEQERNRVIGQLQLDELGYAGSDYLSLATVDGDPTFLGNLLSKQAEQMPEMGKSIPYVTESMSDHNSFAAHGIPALMLCQDSFVFENHTIRDTISILDVDKLTQAAQLVANVAAEVMGGEDGSLIGKSREVTPFCQGFEVEKQTQFYFGMDRNFVENIIAWTGMPKGMETNEYGDTVERFAYPLRWFGMEEPVETLFEYRNGYLEIMEIKLAEATGMVMDEAEKLLTGALGEPEAYNTESGKEYGWGDTVYHKFYSLAQDGQGGYLLQVMDYNVGKEIKSTYDFDQGFAGLDVKNEADRKLVKLVENILFPEDAAIVQFLIYTDGKGNSTGFSSPMGTEDNTRMQYALDSADAFDEQGNWRYYNKTVCTAVHEYGHVLSLNSSQVDITGQDDSLPNMKYDTETFVGQAYLRAYYERFWKDLDVKTGLEHYKEKPEDFVSHYGASDITEDFAESFMLFVLSRKPEDESVASEKIRFFYEFEDMMRRREYIRENLML